MSTSIGDDHRVMAQGGFHRIKVVESSYILELCDHDTGDIIGDVLGIFDQHFNEEVQILWFLGVLGCLCIGQMAGGFGDTKIAFSEPMQFCFQRRCLKLGEDIE